MPEVWKDVKGYEGRYQVSNLGRVRSLRRLLRQHTSNCGYKRVALYKNGVQLKYSVHRLVADVFLLNPKNKSDVNHKNGIKTDNRTENLEWVTKSENVMHAFRVIGRPNHHPNKGKKGKDNWNSKVVIQIKDDVVVAVFYGIAEAARLTGINCISIGNVCRGKYKTAGGYKWKYK